MLKMLGGELAAAYFCGVSAHPSVQLEERIFQRQVLPLFQACAKPVLLMPAKVSRAFECPVLSQ